MPDQVEKTFVGLFVSFLKNKLDSHTLAADAQESIEVAMECLRAAFDLEEAEGGQAGAAATSTTGLKDVDLFELFQSTCIERNSETLALAEKIKNDGNQLMKDGKYNEALLEYNRAIAFDPRNPIFYCNRAAAHIRLGDNERAVTDCKTAISYNANYSKAYGRLGVAYSNMGKYEESQHAYLKAIELEPDNDDYRNNLQVARNARKNQTQNTSAPNVSMPELTEGLNVLLNNPAISNLMNHAGLDLSQLHSMSQNPMVMNAVGQMFTALTSGSGGPATADGRLGGQLPAEAAQVFRELWSQVSHPPSTGNNQQQQQQPPQGDQQPPPSS